MVRPPRSVKAITAGERRGEERLKNVAAAVGSTLAGVRVGALTAVVHIVIHKNSKLIHILCITFKKSREGDLARNENRLDFKANDGDEEGEND